MIVGLWPAAGLNAPEPTVLRVTYLPISHVAPREGEQATAIPRGLSRHLGLTFEASYLYTSYAVEDDWPFDLAHLPGSVSRYDYGFVPERFFSSVALTYAARLSTHPGLVHRQ